MSTYRTYDVNMRLRKALEGPCCARFDPAPWEGRTHEWKDKPFIVETLPQFLHMPLPSMFSRKAMRMWRQAQFARAAPELGDFLLMAFDPSPWKSELYMAVTKPVPGARNVALSGTFFSRTFDGPYNSVPKWLKEMEAQIAGQGRKAARYYVYFTTCPKCAKTFRHNYAVVLAQLA